MASKYGNHLYGINLYSEAGVLFANAPLDVPVTLSTAGNMTRGRNIASASLSFTISGTSKLTEMQEFASTLAFSVSLSGALNRQLGFRATLPVDFTISGELKKSGTKFFRGFIAFIPDFDGRLIVQKPLAGGIDFDFTFVSNEFIGPFWNPETPVDEPWVPSPDSLPPWVPQLETAGPWVPVGPDMTPNR